MKWIKGRDGLPSLFKKVQWRNADGGNIPLPDATPLELYERCGACIERHEWLDSSHPEQGEQGWVSVEDKLPDEFMKVRWKCKDGVEDTGFWDKGNFMTWDIRSKEEVTHWQPLIPVPPKKMK